VLTSYAPASGSYAILQHGLIVGYDDKPTFNLGWSEGGISSGLSAHIENWRLGFNVNGAGNRIDTGKSGLSVDFEQNLRLNALGYANDALVFRHVKKDGTARGFFTFEAPQEGSDSELNGKLQLGSLSLVDAATGLSWASLDLSGTKVWHFYSGITFSSEINNSNFIQQINAAGSSYFHIKVDSGDRWYFDTATWIQGTPHSSTGLLRIQSNVDPMTSGRSMINVAAGTITGQAYLINAAGAVSGSADVLISNTTNTSTGAHAHMELRAGGTGGGDPFLTARVLSGGAMSLGIDNSDNDAIVLSASTLLGSSNRLRIDADKIELGLPTKLPSYTVAGAPSAATVGAGGMIYVSDESGGAVPAFSDGTDWRRMSDRAVVS
jgi:hypothetical protein